MITARRAAAIGTAVLTAAMTGALVPIGAGVAHAAAIPAPTQFLVADTNDDASYGLYRRTTPSGSLTAVVAESTTNDVESVAASSDGTRFVDVETSYNAAGDPLRTRVVVRDVSGRTVQKVDDVDATKMAAFSAVLSPNGTSVVWGRLDFSHVPATYSVLRSAMGGTPTVIGTAMSNGPFLDASTVLVYTNGGIKSMPVSGGTQTPVTGLDDNAGVPVVSPDGSQIAWSQYTATPTSLVDTADILVAPLTYDAGWHVGTPVLVATGTDNFDPSFTDNANITFIKDDGNGGPGATYTAPTNGTATAGTALGAAGDVYGQAMGATDNGTAPGGATVTPATLTGTSATLHWTLPNDPDLSGVTITRSPGGAPTYVPAPLTSRVDTGLVVGTTYDYTITTVDRSGNPGASAFRTLTALLAAPTASDPTSTKASKAPFLVTFGPASPAGTSFSVDYRSNRGPLTYQPWITNVTGTSRTFGSAAATGVIATTSQVGTTYQFRAQATDFYGNSTPQVVSAQPVVPFDQTKAGFVGGTVHANALAWLGSYRTISTTAQKAALNVTGNRLQIIGWRCPSCGAFDVYEGATKIAGIDTRAATTQTRVVLYSRTWGVPGSRTITIKPRGTAGRPNVILDGFAIRAAF